MLAELLDAETEDELKFDPEAASRWAADEFQTLCLKDKRLEKRAKKLLGDLAAQPGASIPKACGKWASTKAAYRCLDNEGFDAEALVAAQRDATLNRAKGRPVVLAVQDTTTLNFSNHPNTSGIGPIGSTQQNPIGLLLHSTLLFCEEGAQALGLLKRQIYARDPALFQTRPAGARNRQPIEEKESYRWLQSLDATWRAALALPGTTFINVADREADIYELFLRHAQMREGWQPPKEEGAQSGAAAQASLEAAIEAASRVELLVRCQHNRAVAQETKRLFEHLEAQPIRGYLEVEAPRKPGQKKRLAKLSLRYAPVVLPAPPDQVKYHHNTKALLLWALVAQEEEPPKGAEPICWRLLSTAPVPNLESAVLKVAQYSGRWPIETFHRILKSGCKAEDCQLESAERLARCITLYCIIAARILALAQAARGPEALGPVSYWLSEPEWKALYCYTHKQSTPPATAPSTRDAVRWIASLGGFLGRKGDGEPGPMTLWRGLQRLNDITTTYLIFSEAKKDVGNA